jgi:hypothetical protein
MASNSGQPTGDAESMKPHGFARESLAGALAVMALAGGTGVARADPQFDPTQPITDPLPTHIPGLTADPSDMGGAVNDWGGVGMFCQNQFVRCR